MRHLIAAVLLGASLALSAQPGDHTLNLKDADIRVFIATVSEITGKSFIVDPRVEGKVNVVSTKPMDAAEVYRNFESVLRVHGYAAVPSGSMVKIVPEAIAKQDGDATAVASGGPDAMKIKGYSPSEAADRSLVQALNPRPYHSPRQTSAAVRNPQDRLP